MPNNPLNGRVSTINSITTRQYAVIDLRGARQLACKIDDEWIIDDTCRSINELMAQGVVCEESVQGWIALQPVVKH